MIITATGKGQYIAEGMGHVRPIIVEAGSRVEAMEGFYDVAAEQQREQVAEELDLCAVCLKADCNTTH